MKGYVLCWGTPTGQSKRAAEPAQAREIGVRVSYLLYDNGVATKREAQEFASYAVKHWRENTATLVQHKSGYTFMLAAEDDTKED
jgi:hypothetical protein